MNTNNYIPHPIDTSKIEVPQELSSLVEALAKNVHEVWAQSRMEQGWSLGNERNDELKYHPSLVPYEELSEEEKDYDRNTAMETVKLILAMGFKIV